MFGKATYNRLPARPEHMDKVLRVLADGELHTPADITEKSRMSKTQTMVALDQLKSDGKVAVVESNSAPKVRVRLAETT